MLILILAVAAVWMAQRLLAVRQAMRFRKQYTALRHDGLDVAVGAAKKVGRRVLVAVAAGHDGIVRENLVFRGVTVFVDGQPEPRLNGLRVKALAAGQAPDDINDLVADAAQQAAGFLLTAADKRAEPQTRTRPAARTRTRTHKVRAVPVGD